MKRRFALCGFSGGGDGVEKGFEPRTKLDAGSFREASDTGDSEAKRNAWAEGSHLRKN
ncbi:MAG: hypothetical protein ACK530_12920 [Alphaproteobacteria bacterium]